MSLLLAKKRSHTLLSALFVLTAVCYVLISLVNHMMFRTYAFDLGFYTHIMWDYAHFHVDNYFMFDRAPLCVLSDHFDLYLMLLSPLVYVFGSYTLLLVQILSVLLGGLGVHRLLRLYTDDEWLPVMGAAVLWGSFGVIHALSFDYHSSVVAAMLLPWLLYYLKKRRFGLATLFVVLFVIGKENMSLWLFFIVTGLMWDYRKDKKALWYLASYAVFSLVWFFLINLVVMPNLGGDGGGFRRYAWLGDSYLSIATNLLSHPKTLLTLLFTNTSGWPGFDGIKTEFYLCALASGMLLTILKPNYLWMLLPLIGQKMFSSEVGFWGISLHYSVEFVPVLVIASFLVILKLKRRNGRSVASGLLLLSVLATTFYTITDPIDSIHRERLCIYLPEHYHQEDFDVRFAHHLIDAVPDDAYVCAASMFVPRLAMRDNVEDFEWNILTEAEYVLIPNSYVDMKAYGGEMIFGHREAFELLETDGTLSLFKRKKDPDHPEK